MCKGYVHIYWDDYIQWVLVEQYYDVNSFLDCKRNIFVCVAMKDAGGHDSTTLNRGTSLCMSISG